jgi:hypothetical protein
MKQQQQRNKSNRIEVRYSKSRIQAGILLSFAIYSDTGCEISHERTEHLRKLRKIELAPMLAALQERRSELPIHII